MYLYFRYMLYLMRNIAQIILKIVNLQKADITTIVELIFFQYVINKIYDESMINKVNNEKHA